jgi:hypothetical protein
MRALVVIDVRDMPQAQGLVLFGEGLSPDVFEVDDCSFDLLRFQVGLAERSIRTETGYDMTLEEVARRYEAIVIITGHNALNNGRLREFVASYLRGSDTPDWSNGAAIVVTLPNTGHPEFPTWPTDQVFTVPSAFPRDPTDQDPSAEWVHRVRTELEGVIRTIDENQTRNPNVGFGLLLVDQNCNFFLMERLREPGKHTLGTIGGNFERGHNIEAQLDTILTRRFGSNRAPRLELGPLLSCTNMKNSYMHYVDITFLAVIREGSVRNVSDAELRPLQAEALGQLPPRSRRNPFLFTLSEVATFHQEGRLFTPVANAFESFSRTVLADQSRYGRHSHVTFPSLLNEREVIILHLPDELDCVREVVRDMHWSPSTMPFFEGDI